MRLLAGVARRPYVALICLMLTGGILGACSQEEATPAPSPAGDDAVEAAPTATEVVIPTLYPTSTFAATPEATATVTPAPTPQPESTIDFERPVIELRYQVPALALDRRLEANVGGRITVVDETLGVAAIRNNQSGILLELQQALPELQLPPLPAECDTCVEFSYELPVDGESDRGWLTDTVMLASVENYTSVLLGPHFPPGTRLGLRRSATPYDVAHSLALTDEGLLWRWLATEPEVAPPMTASEVDAELEALVEDLEADDLAEEYRVDCTGTPVETLYLSPDGAAPSDDSESQRSITITCPAFSLPSDLLPLYVRLDALLQPMLDDQSLPQPPLEIPLDTMLDYQRGDGARLTLGLDGAVRALGAQEEVITETVAASQVISLTTQLLDTEQFEPGITEYVEGEMPNILLARGPQGMAELAWEGASPPDAVAGIVSSLDDLLDQLVGDMADVEDGTPSPTPTPTATSPP